MRVLLPWLLCCSIAAAQALRPLADFNLTEADLERYGFQDTAAGLRDTVRNAKFTGSDRERVLQLIAGWQDQERAQRRLQREDEESRRQLALQAAADPAAQAAAGADGQAAVYDGQTRALDAGDEVIAAWKARQKAGLTPASPKNEQAAPVPAPAPHGPTAAPLGLQGRGTVEKIIGLVMQSLPGPDLADVARRLAQKTTGAPASAASLPALCRAASQACLNELLTQYYGEKKAEVGQDADRFAGWGHDGAVFVKYGEGKKAPGEYLNAEDRLGQAQAQELIALGFKRELGLDDAATVRVILAPGAGLSKNRGVWLSNPVLRRKDGSYDLVFAESVLAAASSREVDLTGPLKAAPPSEREHVLRDILAGEDPLSLGNRLSCLLLGWMQAETLRKVEEGVASGKPAQEARKDAQDAVLSDPLKSRLYAVASNTQNKTHWGSFYDHSRMEGLDEADKDGTSELWTMVGQANAGDAQAAAAFIAALGRSRSGIARAQAADERIRADLDKAQDELRSAEDDPQYQKVQNLSQKVAFASMAADRADQDAQWAVESKKSQDDIAAAQAAAVRARGEMHKAEDELRAAEGAPQLDKVEALRAKINAAYGAVDRADQAVSEARLAWERASRYVDYYEGDIPQEKAKELDLPADFKAKQLRRRVLAGDKTATERFADASVAAEDAAARQAYGHGESAGDPGAPTSPAPRVLDDADVAFLDAFLAALYARPELRADHRAIVSSIAQAKGQRLYDAILARDNSFWPRFFAAVPVGEAAALYDKAPEPIRAKMRTAAAASSPPLRSFLAKIKADPVLEVDAQEERLLQRASRLNGQFSVLDAAGQKVESRYNAYPMMIMEYLQEPDVLGPILEASRRTGMDPYLISAVAFQEGYNVFAEAVENGEGTGKNYYFHSMVGPMGLDTFPGSVDEMKKRGWIRPDFKDYRILAKPGGFDIYGDAQFTGPEPAESALEGMVGLIRKKRAQFLGDAGRLNIRASSLSRQDMELWTYLYFNFTEPKKLLAQYGTSWVWRPSKPGQDVYNVKRVGATAEWLRELKFFDGFWAADKLGH